MNPQLILFSIFTWLLANAIKVNGLNTSNTTNTTNTAQTTHSTVISTTTVEEYYYGEQAEPDEVYAHSDYRLVHILNTFFPDLSDSKVASLASSDSHVRLVIVFN